MKINHSQLNRVVKTCYERKTPIFVWGTMGIGKSQAIRQVAQELAQDMKVKFLEAEADGEEAFSFIDVRISQLEPSDLRGLPVIKDGVTAWLIPKWLPSNAKSKGILFFDELNLAPPSIQASAYQLILDRRIGDYKLPDGWIIVSAGNTSDDKANVYDLPAPLSNRFVHVELNIPNKDDWVNWGLNNGVETDVLAFIEQHPSSLHRFDNKIKSKAFPTPRSWAYCSNLIKDNKAGSEEIEILVSSAIGEGTAHEFMAFNKLKKKIDLAKILEHPESVKDIEEIDLKYSLLSALADKYRTDKKCMGKVIKVCNFMESEFAILLLRYMKGIGGNKFITEIVKEKEWGQLSSKYGKYLLDLNE